MQNRKYVAPDGRKEVYREFTYTQAKFPKSTERPSVTSWKRRSQRQNGEGFGGGRVVGH